MNIFKKIFGNNQNDKKEVITMTNTEKAITLINAFATGDTEKALSFLQKITFSTISHIAQAGMLL